MAEVVEYAARSGLELRVAEAGGIEGSGDVNQGIRRASALARMQAALAGGEGIYAGGAADAGDLGAGGTTYPAVTMLVADDAGNVWPVVTTSATAITGLTTAGSGRKLYAVPSLFAGVSPAAATGAPTASFMVQAAGDPAPAHSLLLATVTVSGGAITVLTPDAGATPGEALIGGSSALPFPAATELTIASGALTVTQRFHTVQPQATMPPSTGDDLDTIEGLAAGDLLVLCPATGKQFTLTNNGNIVLPGEEYSDHSVTIVGAALFVGDGDNARFLGGETTLGSSQTLRNKRLVPRVGGSGSSSPVVPSASNDDIVNLLGASLGLTISAPVGSPVDGQKLQFVIRDNGTSRALTWNAAYREAGGALPAATTVDKLHYLEFVYNEADEKWDCIAATIEGKPAGDMTTDTDQDVTGTKTIKDVPLLFTAGSLTGLPFGEWAAQDTINEGMRLGDIAYDPVSGRVFRAGGLGSGGAVDTVESALVNADGTLGTWRSETSLTSARYGHRLAVVGTHLVITGGYPLTTVEWAEIGTGGALGSWSALESLAEARCQHAQAVDGTDLFILGGHNGAGWQTTIYRLDCSGTPAWSTLTATLPRASSTPDAAKLGSRVYLVDASGNCDFADIGSGDIGTWTSTTGCEARTYIKIAAYGTTTLLVSAGQITGTPSATTETATPAGDGTIAAWGDGPELPAARLQHGSVGTPCGVLAIGGCANADGSGLADTSYASSASAGHTYAVGVNGSGELVIGDGEDLSVPLLTIDANGVSPVISRSAMLGPPTSGTYSKVGRIYQDGAGALWQLTATGTPGTWHQLTPGRLGTSASWPVAEDFDGGVILVGYRVIVDDEEAVYWASEWSYFGSAVKVLTTETGDLTITGNSAFGSQTVNNIGADPTASDFNGLLAALRAMGIITGS